MSRRLENKMTTETLQTYLIPAALIVFFGWRFLRFRLVRAKIPRLLEQGGVVIDVRSQGEFSAGANPNSINMPLGELGSTATKLDRDKPVIVCCASGTRSGMAAVKLRRQGFRMVLNAGPWTNTVV